MGIFSSDERWSEVVAASNSKERGILLYECLRLIDHMSKAFDFHPRCIEDIKLKYEEHKKEIEHDIWYKKEYENYKDIDVTEQGWINE